MGTFMDWKERIYVGLLAAGVFALFTFVGLLAALLVGAFGAVLVWFRHELWLAVVLGAPFAGFFSATQPVSFSMTVSISGRLRGTAMGIHGASNHMGRSLGSMLGGIILAFLDYQDIGSACLILSLIACALFIHIHSTSQLDFDNDDETG